MIQRRRFQRKPVNVNIEFNYIKVEYGSSQRIRAKGKIVDISEAGFGIITDQPLEKGQVIFIDKGNEKLDVPEFGLTRWAKEIDGVYRAGLSYRYLSK